MRKKNYLPVIGILLTMILCQAFTCEGQIVTDEGLVFNYGYGYRQNKYLYFIGIEPDADKHVIVPEQLTFETDEGPVTKNVTGLIIHSHASLIETLNLPRYVTYDFVDHNASAFEIDNLTMGLENLTWYEVDPLNEHISSKDGILYTGTGNTRWVYSVPQKYECDGRVELADNVTGVWDYAVYNLQNVTTLVFTSEKKLTLKSDYSIFSNPNLREIIFKGPIYSYDIRENVNLRCVSFADSQTYFNGLCFYHSPRLVKIHVPSSLRKSPIYLLAGLKSMYLDLPQIETVNNHIGLPQAVRFGDRIKEMAAYWFSRRLQEQNPNHIMSICCTGLTPPPITQENEEWLPKEDFPGRFPGWTIYVPAEAVDTYKADPYWGHLGNVVPITDKLIPVVSEPEVLMEEGWTHDYLWDVMPLGDAVAVESGEWTSDDPQTASIDEDGNLTAHKPGHVRVTFTIRDTKGNSYTASSKVTILEQGGVGEIVSDVTDCGKNNLASVPDGVYDLHGQRVADSADSLAPGLYIRVISGRPEKFMK